MSHKNGMGRRNFLKNSALGVVGAGVAASGTLVLGEETKAKAPEPKLAKIMEYRTLGRTGFKACDISTGGPANEGLLNALLDAGVNYIDTAESYSRGKCETITGNVIKDRDRKSLFITTKLVIKKEDTKETVLKRANKCLERLQTTYIDCLMMHSMATVEGIKHAGFHEAVKQLKAEGKLKHAGISNHGSQWEDNGDPMDKVLLAAVEDGRFDVMLLVYNFVQQEAAERVIEACKKKNIGVTLMKTNPVGAYYGMKERMENMKKEGKKIPAFYTSVMPKLKVVVDQAEGYIKKYDLKNPAEIRDAAIKFVLQNQGVHTVCVSFRNFDDLDTYIKLSGMGLSGKEKKKLAAFKEGCSSLYCRHACGICESKCPQNVPVNTIMRYNHYFEAQGREKHALEKYAALPTAKADMCFACEGHCQDACPYGVPVQGLLTLAHDRLVLA